MIVWAKRLEVDEDAFEVEVGTDCNVNNLKKHIKKEMHELDVDINVKFIYTTADRMQRVDPGDLVSDLCRTGLGLSSKSPYYFFAGTNSSSMERTGAFISL